MITSKKIKQTLIIVTLSFFFIGTALTQRSYALSDKDYKIMMEASSAFKNAEIRLNDLFKQIKKILPQDEFKKILYSQRQWLKERDDRAAFYAERKGVDLPSAYTAITDLRSDEFEILLSKYKKNALTNSPSIDSPLFPCTPKKISLKKGKKSFFVEYDLPSDPYWAEKINRIVNNMADNWKANNNNSEEEDFTEEVNNSIKFLRVGNILNQLDKFYAYSGGAHGMSALTAAVYDLKERKKISFDALFKNPEAARIEAAQDLYKQIYDWFSKDCGHNPQEAKKMTKESLGTYLKDTGFTNFSVSKDGVLFYFGNYDLQYYAAQKESFTVPLHVFKKGQPRLSLWGK